MKQPVQVKVGDRVRDDDSRDEVERIGDVVAVDSMRVKVQWFLTGRTTSILISRIKATRGRSGYSLVDSLVASDSTLSVKSRLEARSETWRAWMLDKLLANAHKGGPEGWENDEVLDLRERVNEELKEFDEAISKHADPAIVRAEAADVANMVMMVADAYEARRP